MQTSCILIWQVHLSASFIGAQLAAAFSTRFAPDKGTLAGAGVI